MGILIAIFAVAVLSDLRCYRIPNVCIAAGIFAGFIITYRDCLTAGIFAAVCQCAVIFAALYPFYLIRGLGAGDIKLLMMTAFYLQGPRLFSYLLATMLLAGAVAGIKIVCLRESRSRLIYLVRYLKKAALTGTVDSYETDNTRPAHVIRVSVPAFASLLMLCAGLYG